MRLAGRLMPYKRWRGEINGWPELGSDKAGLHDWKWAKRRSLVSALSSAGDRGSAYRNGTRTSVITLTSVGAITYGADSASVSEALALAMHDESWRVREEAATALGKVPGEVEALLHGLDDDYWQVRVRSARSLGRTRQRKAVAPLVAALAHSISNFRKEAAIALGEIGSREAIAALTQAVADPDPEVRKAARLAISQIEG